MFKTVKGNVGHQGISSQVNFELIYQLQGDLTIYRTSEAQTEAQLRIRSGSAVRVVDVGVFTWNLYASCYHSMRSSMHREVLFRNDLEPAKGLTHFLLMDGNVESVF